MGYAEFAERFWTCWSCGFERGRSYRDWYPSKIELHHIVRGVGRRSKGDERNLSCLCSVCHRLTERAAIRRDGELLPHLELQHVLWLKREHDPGNYDPEYLRGLGVSQWLPEPERPPDLKGL